MLQRKIILQTLSFFLLVFCSGNSTPVYAYTLMDHHIYEYQQSPIIDRIHYTYYSWLRSYMPESKVRSIKKENTVQPVIKYQVKAGDTLYKIARQFGISVSSLTITNKIQNPKLLRIDQELLIPTENPAGIPLEQNKAVSQVLTSTLTAYTAGVESTGKKPSHPAYGITFSGSKAKEGRTIAVDPKVIPIGSTVYIEGIGVRKAEDTGSAVRGTRIDVFMNDLNEAIKFGVKKNVKVYVLSTASNS